jgi:hypothetical protein
MTHHSHIVRALLFAAALAPAIWTGAAHANDISFVSTAGRNTNACTLAAPCRTLQRAIGVTAAGGEIRVLDSGFFGQNATIRKSLTISGGGNTVLFGNPITVSKAGAIVALRGLTLNGRGTFGDGIVIDAAATVHIEDCLIHGFGSDGITVAAGEIEVFVTGTTVRDGGTGLEVKSGSIARISNSTFTANTTGIRNFHVVETRGNNTIRGNGTDVLGGSLALTPFPAL